MKIKDSLQEEKAAANTQMDQDYWAEKAAEREGGLAEIEEELKGDRFFAATELEEAEYNLRLASRGYVEKLNAAAKAEEDLVKFLDANIK